MNNTGTLTWDAEVLTRISWLQLRARELVAGLRQGGHASVRVTSNVEFADYKDYSPGDSLRDLDWRVLARSDRTVVRRHRAETDLRCTIVLDASGDMDTGDKGVWPRNARPPLRGTKWGYAAVMAATLAWWLHRQGEPVGLALVGGEGVRHPWLPPRKSSNHMARLMGEIANCRPAGRADLGDAFSRIGGSLPRRSLVFVLSDLMEEPSSWTPTLGALVSRRTDVRVAHVHDPAEWSLDYSDASRFVSPEGGEAISLEPSDVRRHYTSVVDIYRKEVMDALGGLGIRHHLISTRDDLGSNIARVLGGF